MDLLPQHAALISASAISPAVAAERGYRSVTKQAELRKLGFGAYQARVPALLLPVWSVTGQIVTYQARPDAPRIDRRKGKAIKYETPVNDRLALDVPPSARVWLGDPHRPLVVTEGIRKADSAVTAGLCCLALLGVWSWRGTNTEGGKVALPDWESVALSSRRCYIVYDSDIVLKPEVELAMVRLKAFLEQRGAEVAIVYLPPGDGGAKVGLDDYLAAGHTVQALLALASSEVRPPPDDSLPPDDLPYVVKAGGIVWQRRGLDGTPTPRRLTNFAATIVRDVGQDDGVEVTRTFEIEAQVNSSRRRFSVPAADFAAMGWVPEHLGANALVFPGEGARDHARAAVQLLSGHVPEHQLYAHLGWRKIGGEWAYLHAGGAIGARGPIADVAVSVPEAISRYVLPSAPSGEALIEALRGSLAFLDLAPFTVTVPLYAAIWRSMLGPSDFGVHLTGPSGGGKSELTALCQQHFGGHMDARRLPASWLSTGNALEALAFTAKDALLAIDDFAPGGGAEDIRRLNREADRVIRAQGNSSGRLRMRADATLQTPKPPRGLILSTGEDVPRGLSLRGRLLVVELGPDDLDWSRLSTAQLTASFGQQSAAMAAYLAHTAADYQTAPQRLRQEVIDIRAQVARALAHRRTPEIIGNLAVGLRWFLAFAHSSGALSADELAGLWERCWQALYEVGLAQVHQQAAQDPAIRFVELVASAITSGRAHVASPDGGQPTAPGTWGWRELSPGLWSPYGDRIGWLSGEDLYLDPQAAYAVAQQLARGDGDLLSVSQMTLRRRLVERHLIASVEANRRTVTVRRILSGVRRKVLHLVASALFYPCENAAQADQSEGVDKQSEYMCPPLSDTEAAQTDQAAQRADQKTRDGVRSNEALVSLVSLNVGRDTVSSLDVNYMSAQPHKLTTEPTNVMEKLPTPTVQPSEIEVYEL